MCHQIRTNEGRTFLCYDGELMLGVKRFIAIGGTLTGVHFQKEYKWDDKGEFFLCKGGENVQEVEFVIGLLNSRGDKAITKTFNCGYHIKSFMFSDRFEKGKVGEFINKCDKVCGIITVPILFKRDDVLFFDGEDVSVKRFRIPKQFNKDLFIDYISSEYLDWLEEGAKTAVEIITNKRRKRCAIK